MKADCIVVMPGLLGDNSSQRIRDLCHALRKAGLHSLAIEPRGYGKTRANYPHVRSTFGLLEILDLIAISDWLKERPYVRDTGLIGFCWGANKVLLAAWEDGRPRDDPDVAPRLQQQMGDGSHTPHFRAGVIAFSPVLRFEETIAQLESDAPLYADPVLWRLGRGIRRQAVERDYVVPSRSLAAMIRYEITRSELYYRGVFEDGMRYLRFLPFAGLPVGAKLESARVPVLIVHAASDPLGSAQDVADLCCGLANEHVAALILSGGGHNGFAAYNRPYYYSLILNFFDPQRGAAASAAETPLLAGHAPLPAQTN